MIQAKIPKEAQEGTPPCAYGDFEVPKSGDDFLVPLLMLAGVGISKANKVAHCGKKKKKICNLRTRLLKFVCHPYCIWLCTTTRNQAEGEENTALSAVEIARVGTPAFPSNFAKRCQNA